MNVENNSIKLKYEVMQNDALRAGEASSKIKKILKQLGINSKIIRRIAIATYEAEMNIVIHSYGGEITATINSNEIMIIAKDTGPGIEDIDLAMQEGYSTAPEDAREMGFGAGMGLPNIKKCSDVFKITSKIGEGTELYIKTYINNK